MTSTTERSDAVALRDVRDADLPRLFEFQREPAGVVMAESPSRDWPEFLAHWQHKIRNDDAVFVKAVLWNGEVAGSIVSFERAGRRFVGYWLGQRFWGRGIASRAVAQFVARLDVRPLHASVAMGNAGSIRVLEKCGFTFAGEADDELVFVLVD